MTPADWVVCRCTDDRHRPDDWLADPHLGGPLRVTSQGAAHLAGQGAGHAIHCPPLGPIGALAAGGFALMAGVAFTVLGWGLATGRSGLIIVGILSLLILLVLAYGVGVERRRDQENRRTDDGGAR